jgi:L-lactate dehydrogenase complex protein LldF
VEKKRAIPITESGGWKAKKESMVWKSWAMVFSNPKLYRLKSLGIAKMGNLVPGWLPVLRNWTSVRTTPRFAKKSLHQMVREEGISDE